MVGDQMEVVFMEIREVMMAYSFEHCVCFLIKLLIGTTFQIAASLLFNIFLV